jgi:peptidoglycan LD-endopeptidase LytH
LTSSPARASRRSLLLGAAAAVVGGVAGTSRRGAAAPQPEAGPDIEQAATVTRPAKRLRQLGSLMFPMEPEPRCNILDNFGDSRSGGRSHEGIDILATLGQEVYAVADGTLTRQAGADASLSGNAWGLTATADGTYYFYGHLSAFTEGLKVGDRVTLGQVIGYVGDTGNAGPGNYHLHFEVHPGGQRNGAVDPLPYLEIPKACSVT